MKSLREFLVLSLALAALAGALPSFCTTSPHFGTAIITSYAVSVIWGLVVAYGLLSIGRRALWLLLGFPLSLLWPFIMLWLSLACTLRKDCI